ncbi:MAG: hypothetical protein Q7U75_15175, partial [Desulfobacterales bacterium]|nr:hypothetical protein [Desulfobacterales bacterium]
KAKGYSVLDAKQMEAAGLQADGSFIGTEEDRRNVAMSMMLQEAQESASAGDRKVLQPANDALKGVNGKLSEAEASGAAAEVAAAYETLDRAIPSQDCEGTVADLDDVSREAYESVRKDMATTVRDIAVKNGNDKSLLQLATAIERGSTEVDLAQISRAMVESRPQISSTEALAKREKLYADAAKQMSSDVATSISGLIATGLVGSSTMAAIAHEAASAAGAAAASAAVKNAGDYFVKAAEFMKGQGLDAGFAKEMEAEISRTAATGDSEAMLRAASELAAKAPEGLRESVGQLGKYLAGQSEMAAETMRSNLASAGSNEAKLDVIAASVASLAPEHGARMASSVLGAVKSDADAPRVPLLSSRPSRQPLPGEGSGEHKALPED